MVDIINKKANKEKIPLTEDNPELQKLVDQENFGKLYAYAIEKITPTEVNELETTTGEWVKYKQGSDHMPLVESLQGFGTGWCTAGESTAQTQLKGGDFYVYYSHDKDNKPRIPRIAIRMQENKIGEVRGIAPEQNLDPYINDVVNEKLNEFPDGKEYQKKVEDMKRLTEIDNKVKKGQELTKEELIFLYEINNRIEGFGYEKDPRIQEIRATRDPDEDVPIVFECEPNQITYEPKDISENTRAYIGPLFRGVFQSGIEHVCASFPEGITKKMETTIGGKDKRELLRELKERKIHLSDDAEKMIESKDFITSKKPEQIQLICLTVADLGFEDNATTDDIYKRAGELGLELCPAEIGPNLRINYEDQPLGDWFWIAMKQIPIYWSFSYVFAMGRSGAGLCLRDDMDDPDLGWSTDCRFLFRFRKPKKNLKS